MHPSTSVILFTSLSGLGFGLLACLGLGFPAVTGILALVLFALAYLLAVGGLVASTFHLGHPERSLKAFSQWRSSWLSREGWCAVVALIVMAVYGAGLVFAGQRWVLLGLAGAALSVATVFTTSMIYTQLKTVPRWHQPLTPVLFLSLSVAGGVLLAGQVRPAIWLLAAAGAVQVGHWLSGDRALAGSGTTLATATGLGKIGRVRAFAPPHTGSNYLLREMVHVVGRKHSTKLRVIAIGLMSVLPVGLLLLPFSHAIAALAVLPVGLLLLPFSHAIAALAVLSHLSGVLVSRWLFFAEAEHVVGLYYGKR